jgi:hypothetical protein
MDDRHPPSKPPDVQADAIWIGSRVSDEATVMRGARR